LIPWRRWISFWKLLALNPLNVKYGSTVRLLKLLQPSSCYLGKKLRTTVAISTVLYPELSSWKNWGLVLLWNSRRFNYALLNEPLKIRLYILAVFSMDASVMHSLLTNMPSSISNTSYSCSLPKIISPTFVLDKDMSIHFFNIPPPLEK